MTKRSEFTLKTKLEAMALYMRCPKCKEKFGSIKNVNFDHINTDRMGGKNTVNNCMPLCVKCHDLKTNGRKHTSLNSDKHTIAKHKRITGQTKTGPKAKIKSRGFKTNRNSPWKKKMNGGLERRER